MNRIVKERMKSALVGFVGELKEVDRERAIIKSLESSDNTVDEINELNEWTAGTNKWEKSIRTKIKMGMMALELLGDLKFDLSKGE